MLRFRLREVLTRNLTLSVFLSSFHSGVPCPYLRLFPPLFMSFSLFLFCLLRLILISIQYLNVGDDVAYSVWVQDLQPNSALQSAICRKAFLARPIVVWLRPPAISVCCMPVHEHGSCLTSAGVTSEV
jgi:hypothetical protein